MKNLDIEPKEATRSQTEEVIVAWRNKRDERLAADKVAKLLKEEEEHFKSWLINVVIQQKFEGMVIGGKIAPVIGKVATAGKLQSFGLGAHWHHHAIVAGRRPTRHRKRLQPGGGA